MSEERLILALKNHYPEIVKLYAERISSGKDAANISDVAQTYLLGLTGVQTDVDFSIYLTNALKSKQFRFSANNQKILDELIDQMKKENYGNKHPMIKLLEEKKPITANLHKTSRIGYNAKQHLLHLREKLNEDHQLKSAVAEHALNHALEHDPEHLFNSISSMKLYGELGEKLTTLRESCLDNLK